MAKAALNPLRLDPSRTTGLRRRFAATLDRRFTRFKSDLWRLVVTEDSFGLRRRPLLFNERWRFSTDPDKVRQFERWLKEQSDRTLQGGDVRELWRRFVEEGYRKGAGRAFDDTRRRRSLSQSTAFMAGTRDEFLRSAFGRPVAIEKIRLIAERGFEDLRGITASMASAMTRTLATGLAQGKSPRDVARDLTKNVDGIGRKRALTLARTETIRAHAEGQLHAFGELGVEELGVEAEWSAAGDGRTCPRCESMSGETYSLQKASGLIPAHPNCRCAWIPSLPTKKPAR